MLHYKLVSVTMRFILNFILLASATLIDCLDVRSNYEYIQEGKGWFKFHRIPAVWEDARLRCQFEGAVLASPTTVELSNALRKVLREKNPDTCGTFTGIHATFSNGDFFSVEGVPLNTMPLEWMPGEPNNFGNNEKCIAMVENGTIGDVSCTDVLPYVCYKKGSKNLRSNQCGTTDNEYTFYQNTGSCYKFHRVARNWTRAFMACAGEGGHLAIPNSEVEGNIMKEIFAKNPPHTIMQVYNGLMKEIMHIGFHDWGEKGDWRTIHGQTLADAGFNRWSGGQPDAFGIEYCGGMFRNGGLDDIWCHENGPFLCEKSPDNEEII